MDEKDRYDRGMAKRRKVLGNAWVDKANAGKTAFNSEFQDFITRYAWGQVWTRPGLAPANRYIGEDLQVTTDFRDVFAEALNRHMGLAVSAMGPIFPGFSASTSLNT